MGVGKAPSSVRRASTSGLAKAALVASASFATTSGSVRDGAKMPYHGTASNLGMVSLMARVSGVCASLSLAAVPW